MLGHRLRAARQRQGYTQAELARYARVDPSYISQIENDHIDSVGSDILRRLAHRLGVTCDYLLGVTDKPWSGTGVEPANEAEWLLLSKFRQLDESRQRLIVAALDLVEEYTGPPEAEERH